MVAHQTSEAKVPGSNPESPIMILMRCRIIVKKWRKSQGKEGNLLLRQKIAMERQGYKIILDILNESQPRCLLFIVY